MQQNYTAIIQQSNDWWIGWVQEICSINRKERIENELMLFQFGARFVPIEACVECHFQI